MEAMLTGGARWGVERGWGVLEDLERIEERGQMQHARPACVSERAKTRQRDEMGTLGSGNHYLEVQEVTAVHDARIAHSFELHQGDIVVMIHCGSRGLGHQIGTEFLERMALCAGRFGIRLADRELACAPIQSDVSPSAREGRSRVSPCRPRVKSAPSAPSRQAFRHRDFMRSGTHFPVPSRVTRCQLCQPECSESPRALPATWQVPLPRGSRALAEIWPPAQARHGRPSAPR